MWAATSEFLILMWHDSTANLLPDFFWMSSRTVPEPKHETYSATPLTNPSTGLTTWVAYCIGIIFSQYAGQPSISCGCDAAMYWILPSSPFLYISLITRNSREYK